MTGHGQKFGRNKTAQVVAMLQRKNGATLTEIMDKMGWQRHTVRGDSYCCRVPTDSMARNGAGLLLWSNNVREAHERRLAFKNQKLSFNPSWMFLGWFAWLVSLV
jgi:hypothetical protein